MTNSGKSGTLSKVAFDLSTSITSTDLELTILQGGDPATGSVLSTDQFTMTNTTFMMDTIVLSTPLPIQQGDTLTFVLSYDAGDNAQWNASSSNPYSEGTAFINVGSWIPLAANDFQMVTFVEQADSSKVSAFVVSENGISIGSDAPDPSAALSINSNSQGILFPRMTNSEIQGINF